MRPDPGDFLKSLAWCLVFCIGLGAGDVVAAEVDEFSLPQLVLIKPGTTVADSAPEGWSDLILKSLPKIESGDIETLPSIAMTTATLFRTLILADVRREKATYRLKRVGIGVCVPVKGVDTVVNVESAAEPPFALSFLEREVLSRVETELKKARLVARTETYAVLATPTDLKVGSTHKKVFLIYAMRVDPETGRLETLIWSVAARADRRTAPSSLNRLAPRLVCNCGLDVVADRLLGTLPVNWSFAARSLPPGDRIVTPPSLRSWLTDLRRIAAEPAEFERILRSDVPLDPKAF